MFEVRDGNDGVHFEVWGKLNLISKLLDTPFDREGTVTDGRAGIFMSDELKEDGTREFDWLVFRIID